MLKHWSMTSIMLVNCRFRKVDHYQRQSSSSFGKFKSVLNILKLTKTDCWRAEQRCATNKPIINEVMLENEVK